MPLVLIADDSMFQRFMLSKIVREAGYETLEAKNGQECIDLGLEKRPDLVILDLNMPEKSGLDVLSAFREAGCDTPVLVLTADIQSTTRELCEQLGAAGFLNKPVDEAALRQEFTRLAASA